MKIYIRSYDTKDKDNIKITEKQVENINEALVQVKPTERIHICRHDEGRSCSLI
jgi:hypothetical protein